MVWHGIYAVVKNNKNVAAPLAGNLLKIYLDFSYLKAYTNNQKENHCNEYRIP